MFINFIILTLFNIFQLNDPLDQFDYIELSSFFFFFLTQNINNNLIFFLILLISLLISVNYIDTTKKINLKNQTPFKFFTYEITKFVDTIMHTNTILPKQFFIIIFYFYFYFILLTNFIGLIPYSYTLTSSFIITLTLSLLLFVLINFLGIYRLGLLPFMGLFLPTGAPLQISFLLVIIEIVSYIARLFSLAIRLFANMMAGHTLLKILIGFSYTMLLSFSGLIPFACIPWLLVTIIFILEVLISFLQAYVFIILICIYSNDVVVSH
jgi:F-type H+-transporting ATPase subunit a